MGSTRFGFPGSVLSRNPDCKGGGQFVPTRWITPHPFFSFWKYSPRHYSYSASFDMINDTAKKWIIGLGISVVVLCGIIAYGIHYMHTSELFLGKRCMDIYMSDYVTEKEKKEMLKDCYWISFYPKKYQDSPQALRERIRKNEAIIDKREWESRIRKGKFKTDKMVGF